MSVVQRAVLRMVVSFVLLSADASVCVWPRARRHTGGLAGCRSVSSPPTVRASAFAGCPQRHRRQESRYHGAMSGRSTPFVTALRVIPVAGRDSMLLNLSGAHAPFFTRNLVILTDSAGRTGRGRGAGRRGDPPDAAKTAAPLVVGQPLGGYRRVLQSVHAPFADRDARRARPADLRPAHHHPRRDRARIRAARPAGTVPRCPGGGPAGRRPAARRASRCWATCSLSATGTTTDLPYTSDPDADDDWCRLRDEAAMTPGPSCVWPRPRASATASTISS